MAEAHPTAEGSAPMPCTVHAEEAGAVSPLVFDSPHSWPHWPTEAPPLACTLEALQTSCDRWVDEIWCAAIGGRAPLLASRFHRSYIDANRAADDIDAGMLSGPWPGPQPLRPSDKSRRGFGLIRRLALPGVPMYDRQLDPQEVQHRLSTCYEPYHARLAGLIDAAHQRHGLVLHIDCHSMKSVGNAMNTDAGLPRPDIVVSDLRGHAADPALVHWMAGQLRGLGYRVGVNDPYQGAELIRRHGAPARGRHSVQIELNRALYMDEATVMRTAGFDHLVHQLSVFVERLCQHVRPQGGTQGHPSTLPAFLAP